MSAFEADLARELRSIPAESPAALRERVRALGEPEPRRFPQLTWRRASVVLVPACAAALLAVAAVRGIVASGDENHGQFAAAISDNAKSNPRSEHGSSGATNGGARLSPTATTPVFTRAQGTFAQVPTPTPARHQDYQADLRVRVDDLDTLGRRTAQAMRVTRDLGGYVASVQQSTAKGSPGEADLVLRVPVAHVQDAMIRLSALGTVLEQHVSIVDLENTVQAERQRIRALRLQIVRLTAALTQSLPADVRLRLQFQLDDARRNLANATGAQKSTLRQAAMSQVSLSLTTEHAVAGAHHDRGRFGRAMSKAFDFLGAEATIALAILIVLAPLAVIAALLVFGLRAYRRRSEERLLAAS